MRITVVNQPVDGILPPNQNSIGIWTYEVARRLAENNRATVIGRVPNWRAPWNRTDRGVRYRFLPAAPNRVWTKVSEMWTRVFGSRRPIYGSTLYYLEYAIVAAIAVRRSRPDVIHLHNFTGFVPTLRLFNRRTPIVLHMSCEWLSQLDEATMAHRIGAVDMVLGTSDHITDLVRQRFPQYAQLCHTLYNGVDPEEFLVVGGSQTNLDEPPDRGADADTTDRSGPRLVFVGRVSPEKGVHDMLDAMPTILDSFPDAVLEIIGPVGALPRSYIVDVSDDHLVQGLARFYDHDYGATLHERAARFGVHVRFTGGLPHEDVVQHIADADVLVNPSYSESFGMALVEAMACGTPVAATRVGGMRELVTDDVGVLVERADPQALAAAIVALLEDPRRRDSMAQAGRTRVEQLFSWDVIAADAAARYRALASGGGRSE